MAKYGELQAKYPDLEVWGHPAEFAGLFDLTVAGIKTATSSWHASYVASGEDFVDFGRSIMVDNPENPTREVLLVTDFIKVERFSDISKETAFRNAEGDKSVADWKRIFGDFWKRQLPEEGLTFSEDGLVVTDFFHVEES